MPQVLPQCHFPNRYAVHDGVPAWSFAAASSQRFNTLHPRVAQQGECFWVGGHMVFPTNVMLTDTAGNQFPAVVPAQNIPVNTFLGSYGLHRYCIPDDLPAGEYTVTLTAVGADLTAPITITVGGPARQVIEDQTFIGGGTSWAPQPDTIYNRCTFLDGDFSLKVSGCTFSNCTFKFADISFDGFSVPVTDTMFLNCCFELPWLEDDQAQITAGACCAIQMNPPVSNLIFAHLTFQNTKRGIFLNKQPLNGEEWGHDGVSIVACRFQGLTMGQNSPEHIAFENGKIRNVNVHHCASDFGILGQHGRFGTRISYIQWAGSKIHDIIAYDHYTTDKRQKYHHRNSLAGTGPNAINFAMREHGSYIHLREQPGNPPSEFSGLVVFDEIRGDFAWEDQSGTTWARVDPYTTLR